jgi:hypothetical protein
MSRTGFDRQDREDRKGRPSFPSLSELGSLLWVSSRTLRFIY